MEYGPIIQDLYKQHNKKGNDNQLVVHHCYKELVDDEK